MQTSRFPSAPNYFCATNLWPHSCAAATATASSHPNHHGQCSSTGDEDKLTLISMRVGRAIKKSRARIAPAEEQRRRSLST